MVAHDFNSIAGERKKQADLCEFDTSLGYRASSRRVKAVIQRNPVSKLYIYIPAWLRLSTCSFKLR